MSEDFYEKYNEMKETHDEQVSLEEAQEASVNESREIFSDSSAEPSHAETVQPMESEAEDVTETAQPIENDHDYGDYFKDEPTAADRVFSTPYSDSNSDTPSESQTQAKYSYNYRKVSPDDYAEPSASGPSSGYRYPYGYNQPQQNSYQPSNPYVQQQSYSNQRQAKPKKQRAKISAGAVAVIPVVCMVISAGFGFGGAMLASYLSPQSTVSDGSMVIHQVEADTATAETSALVDKSTAKITEEVADSVVEITTEVMQTGSFYGQYIAQGAGSGVIISEDGYIITNNHVIEDATSVKVTLRNQESYNAEVIGSDSLVDIALLKIDAKDLTPAVFGDSDKLAVGDKSVIIGNPLGTLGGSVTEGIVSALDRSIVIDGKTMQLLQTDASINPGNSGGGMFNGQGELCGIVVAKSSSSASSGSTIDNIGFVIPINNVVEILSDLKESGYVRGRADTGMTFVDLSNSLYSSYYYGNQNPGCYVYSVSKSSNAYEAGFRAGDRVVSVDGQKVESSSDITDIISKKSAGDEVEFELERGEQTGTLKLKLEEDVPDDNDYESSNGFGNNNNGNNGEGGFGGGDSSDPFGGLFP